jgi:mRNA interferase MazF
VAYHGPVRRWDLFWADLEPHRGREQAGSRRPVLVVFNDGFNRNFDVVTVVPLSKLEGKTRKQYPWEIALPSGTLPSPYTSLALVGQVRTIAKARLLEYITTLQDEQARYDIEGALLDHFGIDVEE